MPRAAGAQTAGRGPLLRGHPLLGPRTEELDDLHVGGQSGTASSVSLDEVIPAGSAIGPSGQHDSVAGGQWPPDQGAEGVPGGVGAREGVVDPLGLDRVGIGLCVYGDVHARQPCWRASQEHPCRH